MKGEAVTVVTRTASGKDGHGNPTYTTTSTSVSDVLVAPGPRTDLPAVDHPDGTVVAYNLHFPKSYTGSLRGAVLTIRGQGGFKVIGDPRPFTLENTPTRWHMPVEVERADG
jgi:hypothetical protein